MKINSWSNHLKLKLPKGPLEALVSDDVSAKMQMKMGLSYASFFTRIEELDSSDEDELKVRLSDGLRVWLKFGMNVTGNEQVI